MQNVVGNNSLPVKQTNVSMGLSPGGHYPADICKICYEAEGDAAFIPCGHNFACVKCAQRCECCPVCRIQFDDIIKLYKNW
jgi:hypothetical protein